MFINAATNLKQYQNSGVFHCIQNSPLNKTAKKHFRPRAVNTFYTTNGIRGVILLINDDWIVRNIYTYIYMYIYLYIYLYVYVYMK